MEAIRFNEKLTSKERVLATFAHCNTDRVPVNYSFNPGVDDRLKKALGLKHNDNEGLMEYLGVDFRGIWVPYTGPRLHKEILSRGVDPEWGFHTRWVEHDTGGYWDYCDYPLMFAEEDEVASWPMPSPDDYDYNVITETVQKHEGKALYFGDAGLGCIINTAGFFRGMEQVFIDLATDEPAGLLLIDRFLDLHFERMVRALDKIGKKIDFVWMGEDLGTQIGPMISKELFRKHILPRHKRFLDLATSYNLPVMLHTCGSSSWSYEDYISIGLKAVDTLQPEAANMSPTYLKQQFGGQLVFHGCISTTGVLSFGSKEDTINDVKNTLDIMMPGGGYCLAPTHCLQDNTPTENVFAMYETAHRFGRY